jgi:CDP-diacylglycerol--glycerol-3-phosphate 3-phosphatidyltransferase
MLLTPNMLSIFRLCLVPVFVLVYLSGIPRAHIWSALVYVIAALTDILDGWMARRFHLITNLGKVLDPLGDKMFTLAVLACLTIDQYIPLWILAVYTAKELLMGLGGLVLHKRAGVEIPPANYLGKAATALFFLVFVLMILFSIPRAYALIMICVAMAVSLAAFASYLRNYRRIMQAHRIK